MITRFHLWLRGSSRLLALLVALGVALMPFMPGQTRAVCRMAVSIQAACCCATMAMEDSQQRTGAHATGGHDKRPCCEVVAIDQHQPVTAVEIPSPAATESAVAMVVAVLPAGARVAPPLRACGPEPAPDGPPRRVLWCSFKT